MTSFSRKEAIVDPFKISKLCFAKGVPFIPFIKIKYEIAVSAIPPNNEPTHLAFSSNLKDKSNLETY